MNKLFHFAKRVMPTISQTEKIALQSGSVSFEKQIFQGSMTTTYLQKYKPHQLSKVDIDMIQKIPDLVKTVREYDILRNRTTPKEHPFWQKAKDDKFFSLIVPEEYGGKKMSATGLSKLLQNLSSVSASIPVHVMVPNSLGPSELLAHYGTPKQREYFLPKLSEGAIPCFGLTSLYAGSDAAGSMTDTGTIVKENGKIKIRLQCEKRYITLAPVADIIGIAFKIVDPHNLSQEICDRNIDGEITLALLEKNHSNLKIGTYIDPLGVGFANGTISAQNLYIDIEDVIGGVDGLGNGWKFLMEALAAGRGTALPAGAAGSSKMLTNAVSGYCTVRKQFKISINKFEGIQEKLTDMAICTYEIDSMVSLMNTILDNGERPPILSAILKQRTTELGRHVVNHAMDICAGAAICMGDNNFVAPAYLSTPIGITVEGSNTMTRSLLIFGQGIVRSHPHMLNLIQSIEDDNEHGFKRIVLSMIKDNATLVMSPTLHLTPLEKFTRFFALSSNASLLLGGELKRKEFLSGRYADILSYIVAGHAMHWHARNSNMQSKIVEVSETHNLHRLEETVKELVSNHPHRLLHQFIYWKTIGFSNFASVKDSDKTIVANELCSSGSDLRSLFSKDTLHLHPNVKRIEEFMNNTDRSDKVVEEILSVDTYVSDSGKLIDGVNDEKQKCM